MPVDMLLLTAAIVLSNAFALFILVKDLWSHRAIIKNEPGKPLLQAFTAFGIYFLNAFGISDFSLSTVIYSRTKWVNDKKLPGTLNTQPLLPACILSLAYLYARSIELATLIPCIAAQMIGAFLGPRLSVRLNVRALRKIMSFGLFCAGAFILARQFGFLAVSGNAKGVYGINLAIMIVCFFVLGVLKTMGIGSFPFIMTLTNIMGLNPMAAYPLMMGSGTFAAVASSTQFIKLDSYARRITFFTTVIGTVAAIPAVFVIKSLNVPVLQWIMIVVVFFAAFDMLFKSKLIPAEKVTESEI